MSEFTRIKPSSVANTLDYSVNSLTAGNTVANSIINSSVIIVGGTVTTTNGVVVNTSAITLGNTTANAIYRNNLVSVANTSSTANLTPSALTIGTTSVNAALINAAALNVVNQTNTATLYVTTSANVGTAFTANSTLTNAIALNVVNQTNTDTLYVTTSANVGTAFTANSTVVNAIALNVVNTVNVGSFGVTNGVNITNTSTVVGNSTANATFAYNLLQVSNSTGTSNLTPTSLNIGLITVNSALANLQSLNIVSTINVGSLSITTNGFAINTTSIRWGNSTVNGIINSTAVSVTNNTVSACSSLARLFHTNSLSIGITTPVAPNGSIVNTVAIWTGNTTSNVYISGNLVSVSNSSNLTSTTLIVSNLLTVNSTSVYITRTSEAELYLNRLTTTGTILDFQYNTVSQGSVSIAADGTTIQYNTFLGSHWSCLSNRSKINIPIGTILDSVGKSVTWLTAIFNVEEEYEQEEVVYQEDGSVSIEQKKLIRIVEKKVPYNGPLVTGDSISVEYNGKEYNAILYNLYENEPANKHVCVKINDTPRSKAVYGVFSSWEENNEMSFEGSWNDIYVASVGLFFIRIAAGQQLQIGDLIEAGGNGCGVVQDDDIIRSKTVGKVLSTEPQQIYEDGSFIVPCVLYCG